MARELNKPPLGIIPRQLYEEGMLNDRIDGIIQAMSEYRRQKYIIPVEWADELACRLREFEQLRKRNGGI